MFSKGSASPQHAVNIHEDLVRARHVHLFRHGAQPSEDDSSLLPALLTAIFLQLVQSSGVPFGEVIVIIYEIVGCLCTLPRYMYRFQLLASKEVSVG